MTSEELHTRLADAISPYRGMLVAFSGGVDSTVLAVVAREVLGDRMLAVLSSSDIHPGSETEAARALALDLELPLEEVYNDPLENEAFAANEEDRCYHCKRDLFSALLAIAEKRGLPTVADGTNADDLSDHRPGIRASTELGVVSPIAEAGLTKEDVREVARLLRVPNAEKPPMACLASRFPYGEPILAEGLARVETAESGMHALGFEQFRVRSHGLVARVEVAPEELDNAWRLREGIVHAVKAAGFAYMALDLEGYRTGALNEVLDGAEAGTEAGTSSERDRPSD